MMAPEEGALLGPTIPKAPSPKGPQVAELSEQTAAAGWLMVEHRALERERKTQSIFMEEEHEPHPNGGKVPSFFTFLL